MPSEGFSLDNKKCKLQKSSLFFAIVLHLLRHMVDKFYWEANVQSAHHFALCPFEKLYFCDPRTTRVFFCDTGCCIEIVHEMDKTNVFPLLRKESSIQGIKILTESLIFLMDSLSIFLYVFYLVRARAERTRVSVRKVSLLDVGNYIYK